MEPNDSPKLVIRYKEDQARTALFLAIALAPVWGIWALYVCSWLAKAVIQGGFVGYEDLFLLLIFYLGLVAIGSFTVLVCLDNKFALTEDGLELPRRFLLDLALLRKRPWSHLDLMEFKNDELILRFGNTLQKGQVRFRLAGVKTSDLKDLVVAVRSNAPETLCLFDRKAVEMGIPGIQANQKDESFTAIWERDLASRFGSTAFVPLEAKSRLQNGRLTVIGQISFGGLSAVYLCKDNLGETVILKEAVVPLNADAASKDKALEMFQREAKILQGLSHPNIARVLDHFVENGRDYMVIEHINGMDLRAYVKEHGPQPERLIMRWAMESADILQYLHNQNPPIIHRDVTPDNLVLDRTGAIKLIDFGAANEFIATATGTLVGKQSYISPEQFRGKAVPQSDIYALGCTLYYLANGCDPEALSQSTLPDELAVKMPALNKLIRHCTAMELEDRLPTMDAVADEARQYMLTIQKQG
jgi:Protein kinase domain